MDVKRKEVGGEEGSEYLELTGGLKQRLITVYLVTFLYDFIHIRIEKGCRDVGGCACLVDTVADVKQVGGVAMQLHDSSCELVSGKHTFHEAGRKTGRYLVKPQFVVIF